VNDAKRCWRSSDIVPPSQAVGRRQVLMSHPQRAEGRHRAARHHPAPKDGRPTDIDLCAIVNACSPNIAPHQWRLLPANFLPMSSVRSYFDTWNRDGTCINIMVFE